MSFRKRLFERAFGKRLATYEGRLDVDGVRGSVTIRRDAFAIPYIEADNDHDAWFALGFCQGQDRGFQLEMLVRLVRGEVAALIGGEGLAMDRVSRRIG